VVHDGQPKDSAAITHAQGGPSPPPDPQPPGADAPKRPTTRAWRDKATATAARVKTGSVGTFWSRLNAVDFMNSTLMFAGLFLVCFFPFLAVVDAAAGRNTQKTITDRLGLSGQAAHDVDALISTGNQTVSALSVLGAIVLVLFAIGIPGVLQAWYEKVYEQTARYGGLRQFTRKLIWVGLFLVYIWLEALVGQQAGPAGGRLLTFVCEFVIAVLFWWGTIPAGRPDRLAGPVPRRPGHRVLPHRPGRLLPAPVLRVGHLRREQLRAHRRGTGAAVLPHRGRRLPAPRRRLRPDVERTPPAARLCALSQRNERNGREVASGTMRQPGTRYRRRDGRSMTVLIADRRPSAHRRR